MRLKNGLCLTLIAVLTLLVAAVHAQTFSVLHRYRGGCKPSYRSDSTRRRSPGHDVFKVTNTPNGWVYSSLYDFLGLNDGFSPNSPVAIDTDGTLYGTTLRGGNIACGQGEGCGVVWMIKP